MPERWKTIALSPNTAEDNPWYRQELFDSFARLRETSVGAERFVFFIDGLDEYGGDHQELVSLLRSLQDVPYLKLCLASRPHNVFDSAFGSSPSHVLALQDFTGGDIRRYICGELENHPDVLRQHQLTREMSRIIAVIAEKASGVFLWVYLVVKSVSRGITNADTPADLLRRVQEMPPDLEPYFESMLDSIEPYYRNESSRMLLACISAVDPIPLGELLPSES